jgi:2-isopropylmalate synthase
VAAAELGLLAGGDRIEGCLLGNGERTGNVDLISLALNMYSQGVSPKLDFSNLPDLVALVCKCNEMAVPTRYPYAGQLVFSAFAGTHQDAIKKGLDAQAKRWADVDRTGQGKKYWAMPYIPLDPKDLGYGYENLIRVSSQSGKAGTAYVIKQTMLLDLPRRMQVALYKVIQDESERSGKEMTPAMITTAFKTTYSISSKPMNRIFLKSYRLLPLSPSTHEPSSPMSDFSDDPFTLTPPDDDQSLLRIEADVVVDGSLRSISGDGRGVVLAMLDALKSDLEFTFNIGESAAHTINADNIPQAKCATFLELCNEGTTPSKSGVGSTWGVGISSDVATSKCRAVISAASHLVGDKPFPRAKMVFTPRSASKMVQGDNWLQEVTLRAGRLFSHSTGSRQSLKVQTTV